MREALLASFEASWARNEAAYRYLEDGSMTRVRWEESVEYMFQKAAEELTRALIECEDRRALFPETPAMGCKAPQPTPIGSKPPASPAPPPPAPYGANRVPTGWVCPVCGTPNNPKNGVCLACS